MIIKEILDIIISALVFNAAVDQKSLATVSSTGYYTFYHLLT